MLANMDYLLTIIREDDHLDILKNARIGGEVVLHYINNILEAARL